MTCSSPKKKRSGTNSTLSSLNTSVARQLMMEDISGAIAECLSRGKNQTHRTTTTEQYFLYDTTNEMFIPLVAAATGSKAAILLFMHSGLKISTVKESSKNSKKRSTKSSKTSHTKRK